MPKKKKIIAVSLILLLYFLIAIVGFFIVYFIKNSIKIEKKETSTISKISKISPAPTGFKEYKNPKQNFSVSYPDNLSLKEQSYGFGVNTIELRDEKNTDTSIPADIQILTVPKAIAKAVGQDFDIYYQMGENETKIISGKLKGIDGEEKFTKIKNREIQGMKAVEYSSVPNPNPEDYEPEIGVFIETGNDMTIIATGESQRGQLEEILRTFTYPIPK